MPAKKGATEEAKAGSKKTKAEEKPKKKEEESEDMGEEEEDMEEEAVRDYEQVNFCLCYSSIFSISYKLDIIFCETTSVSSPIPVSILR